MRYRITLLDDPTINLMVRAKYIAAFGDACYVSEANTFDCFYKEWPKACAEVVRVGEVSGNAPYDKGYTCQPDGQGNYWLQTGSDVANRTWVYFMEAPRQAPRIDINGVPTEVSGPYRNLVDPNQVGPGNMFDRPSGMFNNNGDPIDQQKWVLAVNRKNNGGKIRSDLAGFKFPCKKGSPEICTEPDFLEDAIDPVGTYPNVHHVVPRQDKRCCSWGTNSYKNAAVISQKLNNHFTNDDPPEEEVNRLNNAAAYSP